MHYCNGKRFHYVAATPFGKIKSTKIAINIKAVRYRAENKKHTSPAASPAQPSS